MLLLLYETTQCMLQSNIHVLSSVLFRRISKKWGTRVTLALAYLEKLVNVAISSHPHWQARFPYAALFTSTTRFRRGSLFSSTTWTSTKCALKTVANDEQESFHPAAVVPPPAAAVAGWSGASAASRPTRLLCILGSCCSTATRGPTSL